MKARKRRVIGAIATALALLMAGCASELPFENFVTLLRAEHNLDIEKYHKARELARQVLAAEPRNKRALVVAGWSAFKLDRYAEALEAFKAAEAIDRDDSDYVPQAGIAWSQFKLGNLDAAKVKFLKADARPRHYYETWDIEDGLGWIAYVRGDFGEAKRLFAWRPHPCEDTGNDACEGDTPDAWGWQKDSWVGRGLIAMNQNRLGEARNIFAEGAVKDPDYFRSYDGLARVALVEGRYEEALEWALEAAERVDFDEGLAFLIEAIVDKLGSHERGIEILAGLASRSPKARAYYPFLGRMRLKAGQLKEAEAAFLKALDFDPGDDWAKSDLAEVRRRMNAFVSEGWSRYFEGDYEGALAVFRAKQRQADQIGNPAAEAGRGWALLSLGRFADARQAFVVALRIDPNFATAADVAKAAALPHLTLYDQGWALAETGHVERAKRQFLRAATRAPNDFQWKIEDGLAWLLWYQKAFDKADTAFRRVLKKYPGAYLSRKGLAYVALEKDDYAAAEKHLLASLSQESKQIPASYTFPAVRFIAGQRYQTARKFLELGEKVHAESADIQYLLAKAYMALKDPRTAAAKAVKAASLAPVYIHPAFDELSLDPMSVRDAYLALAKGLYFSGDTAGAIMRVNDYIKAGGTDPGAVRLRGFALFRQARYVEANKDLAYAARSEPKELPAVSEVVPIPGTGRKWRIEYDARSTLAWSHLRLGHATRAARQFRAVIDANPMWIDALSGLGYSLIALGDRSGAVEHFRRALIVSPGYPDAWLGLERAKAER